MHKSTPPAWFTPLPHPIVMRTAAEIESADARSLALRMDHMNAAMLRAGLPPAALRSEYPIGYGPGQLMHGSNRAALAAYVDGAGA